MPFIRYDVCAEVGESRRQSSHSMLAETPGFSQNAHTPFARESEARGSVIGGGGMAA